MKKKQQIKYNWMNVSLHFIRDKNLNLLTIIINYSIYVTTYIASKITNFEFLNSIRYIFVHVPSF